MHKVTLSLRILLALLINSAYTQNNPFRNPNSCGKPTCSGTEKFRYQAGLQQVYKYYVDIKNLFQGTSTNQSTLYIEAQVTLDFISECDGLLSFSNIKLSEDFDFYKYLDNYEENVPLHKDTEIFSQDISRFTLRFGFQDGIISELCPHEEETVWVLNFKRGFLSMVHNSMKRFDLDHRTLEDDVHGNCDTLYTIKGTNGTGLLIEKYKHLNFCTRNSRFQSFLQSSSYKFHSNNRNEYLMKSESKCQLSVDHHVYNGVACEETHMFQPFSNNASGALTIVKQILVLQEEVTFTLEEQPSITRRTSLLYDNLETPKQSSGELKMTRDLLKQLCRLDSGSVQVEFSDIFTKFVYSSRTLSPVALSSLYGHAGTICINGKQYIMDALPYINTAASFSLMKDIILTSGINENTLHQWMSSITFISRPNEEMLKSALTLLDHRKDDFSVMLSVAALTHTFCIQNSECRLNEQVSEIVNMLESRVVRLLQTMTMERETQEAIIVSLKALSNIGVSTEMFVEHLYHVIEDVNLNVGIRVVAVETFRRFSCEEFRTRFERIFNNAEEDSEIRIASYLQIMRCPNYMVIRGIRNSLLVEEVNQVGSFVWSHLHNLMKSSSPNKVEIQSLLSDNELSKKFNGDVRKFSHNFEGSFFSQDLNLGANYENNIIFSTSSYIPRSASFNISVDLFGESINIFEVGSRVEGFEHYLEEIFGPKGYFNAKAVHKKLPKMRWLRDAIQSDNSTTEINNLPNVITNNFNKPKVSLGFKVFGNEVKYSTFEGKEELLAAIQQFNLVDHLKKVLSGKEIDYKKTTMFLDSKYCVPSGAGFPITLSAVGTSSVNVKLHGSLQAANFMKTKELDLSANIQPSAVVNIIGTMSVDVYYAATAIKLKTSLHTSSAVEGSLKIRGSNLISLRFGLPKEHNEIFAARSELVVMKNQVEQLLKEGDHPISESLCSWPVIENTVGLKLCTYYNFPNTSNLDSGPFFILAGPTEYKISLLKTDVSASDYIFEYKWTKIDSGSIISLTYDTPGSLTPRILGVNLTLNTQNHDLSLLLHSSAGTFLARGKYKNTETEKGLQLVLDINDKQHLDASVSLESRESRYGYTYLPKVYLGVNGERVADFQGTLKWVSKKGISQCDVDLKFQTKRLTSKMFGYISKSDASIGTNLKLDYKFLNTKEQRVLLEFSLANRSTRTIVAIIGNARVDTTAYSNFNFDVFLKFQKAAGRMECKIDVNNSEDIVKINPNRISMAFELKHKTKQDGSSFDIGCSINRTITDLDMGVAFSYYIGGPKTNIIMKSKYAKEKDIVFTVYWTHPRSSLQHYEGLLSIKIPEYTPFNFGWKIHERHHLDYYVEFSATWFTGQLVTAIGVYQDRSTAKASSHHLKLVLKSPSFEDIDFDILFYRDDIEIKSDIKANHNKQDYGLFFKHRMQSAYDISTQMKIKFQTKVYSFSNLIQFSERTQILLEVHIDQIRDIQLSVWANNRENQATAGVEIKWDANREPNQKLVLTVSLENSKSYNYDANFVLSFPGRTINGLFTLVVLDNHLSTLVHLAWSPLDVVSLKLSTDYKIQTETELRIKTELVTPFEKWSKTSLKLEFIHVDNMYKANCTIRWFTTEYVTINFFEDYAILSNGLWYEFSSGISSSIEDFPSFGIHFKHNYNLTKVDTNLHVSYNPKQVISVKSSWYINEDSMGKNYTGTVTLMSPFVGYSRGLFVSKVHLSKTCEIRGVSELDLDHRKYTTSIEGHYQKITRSMFVFNITTPIEKFNKLTGRLGFLEDKKHLAAFVQHSTGTSGIEIKLVIDSLSSFDIKFLLGTPIEFLHKFLLIGYLTPQKADFKIGWNFLLAGFSGIWHYANITDFEYLFKLYTPIEGFEENGIVARLIYNNGLELEASGKLADGKMGLVIVGKPKATVLNEMGIKTQVIYNRNLANIDDNKENDESDNDYEEEIEDPINWGGLIEVDLLIYPTIKGTLDIEQKGNLYVILSTFTLPNGTADLTNEFTFIDYFTMHNKLQFTLPYNNYKVVTSNYDLQIVVGQKLQMSFDINYLNESRWINTGSSINYFVSEDEEAHVKRELIFHIHTPYEVLPKFEIQSTLQTEEHVNKLKFFLNTTSSNITLDADLKIGTGLLSTNIRTYCISPFIVIPETTLIFTKNFTAEENKIAIFFDMLRNKPSKFDIEVLWKIQAITNFKFKLAVVTPIRGMENVQLGALLLMPTNNGNGELVILLHPLSFHGNITIQDNEYCSHIMYEFKKKRREIILQSTLLDSSVGIKEIRGHLKVDGTVYLITGSLELSADNRAKKIDVHIKHDHSLPFMIQYQVHPEANGKYIIVNLMQADQFINLEVHTSSIQSSQLNTHFRISTSNKRYAAFELDMQLGNEEHQKSIALKIQTPFEDLENASITIFINKLRAQRTLQVKYQLKDIKGHIDGEWCWLWLENMSIKFWTSHEALNSTKKANVQFYYVNPQKNVNALQLGSGINLNGVNMGNVEMNVSIVSIQNLKLGVIMSFPTWDTYTVDAKFISDKKWNNIEYYIKHSQKSMKRKYGSSGKIVSNPHHFNGDINLEWNNQRIDNFFNWEYIENQLHFQYLLHTPKFNHTNTFATNFDYVRTPGSYHHIKSQVFYPGDATVFDSLIYYKELGNLNGRVNITTPFKTLKNIGSNFKTETNSNFYNRYIQIFWPTNSAFIDSKCSTIGTLTLDRNVSGVLLIEVPLATKHTVKVDYNYDTVQEKTTGWATAVYNTVKIVDGKYKCLSESRAGYDNNTIFMEFENKLLPVGILYIHTHEYNEHNPVTVDFRRIEAYNLQNKSGFNMTGEMVLRTTGTGQQIQFTAIHANRTVKLWTDYNILDDQFKQHSKLELEPTVWIGYDINIMNKTQNENMEAQSIQIDISYPRRTFTATGFYNHSEDAWIYDGSLTWDQQQKTIAAALDWKQNRSLNSNCQQIELQIKHPSFEKDLSLLGEYQTNDVALVDIRLTVDYSTNSDQKLELNLVMENHSDRKVANYTYTIIGNHPATNLYLHSYGEASWRTKWYYIAQQLDYKRTYLPLQSREAFAMIDLHNYELELKKKSLRDLSYFWSKFGKEYPLYTVNISALQGSEINATGKFFLHVKDKLTRFDLNMTEDGSQSVHMFGNIPDARQVIFDIWRQYDDFIISDVAFFLRLNHSRLILSSLLWRPEMKQQLQKGVHEVTEQFYKDFVENVDYWKQYIRSETADAITDVWQDSKPSVEKFLDDLRNLKTIENDITDFINYLNQSYNANDFYIHDIVGFCVHFLDELAIKSHFESLPRIVSELWDVMGESGQKIQKGIVWVIETIKDYYKNAIQVINVILQRDQLEHLSQALAQMLEKYDTFMKDLHVSTIRYIESLWKQVTSMLVENWHNLLAIMEPTFLKMLHIAERLVWDTSRDFLDFLYVQKRELLESPYFGKFSNLSYDIDKFYKDISKNSAIASVYKYTMVIWNFLNDKLFKLIPFGKEFQDIASEVLNELRELKKLPAFRDLVDMEIEVYQKLKSFYNYFNMHERLERFLNFIQFKLMDLRRTALDIDNRQREAKTKFVFDPNEGIVYMEQKLPMPWHAFNETPKFQEIPEYKTIHDIQNYFVTSKTTFWSLYYDYKPYIEPSDWFPPFKAQALIIGSHYYVTFDRTYYNFSGECSYLLASDFVDHNFTLVVSYDDKGQNAEELVLFVGNTNIHINILKSAVQLNSTQQSRLPFQLEDLSVYHESDIITIESASGFILQCNLRFHVCMVELSGWYFGKTAGLLGTMNHEPSDDLLTSDKKKVPVSEINMFSKSWEVDKKCFDKDHTPIRVSRPSEEITKLCEVLFSSSVSHLAVCFPRVAKDPFLNMCLYSSSEEEACASAIAYMQLCTIENTPLRIPEECVKCHILNGTVVSEGVFVRFEDESVPRSTDIVFIIEAKDCNRDLRTNLTFDSITDLIHKELLALNVTQNRYSVVVFGGSGIFDKPRSISINSKIFTDHNGINQYLDNIPIGKGNSDIFAAIVFATKLIFRPGASKTFILLPCSDCHESNMKLDYAILNQQLLENDITLHILMNNDFLLQKERINKILFGIDRSHAFTKKDVKELKGDGGLLKQVLLPKSTLGFCTTLALENKGSLFNIKKIQGDKKSTVKRFATVFGKRVASSAVPGKCQMCECTAQNTGISYMECFPCNYPTPAVTDYGLNEDETLTMLQPSIENDDVNYT